MKIRSIINLIYVSVFIFILSISSIFAYETENMVTKDGTSSIEDKCPKTIEIKDPLDFDSLNSIFTENKNFDFSNVLDFFDDNTLDDIIKASTGPNIDMVGNKYCPIYCVEENLFSFPGYSPVVNSGGHFTWTLSTDNKAITNGLTVNLQGKKVCTSKIDLKQWIDDYSDVLNKIDEIAKTLKTNTVVSTVKSCTPEDTSFKGNGKCTYNSTGRNISTRIEQTNLDRISNKQMEANEQWQNTFQNHWSDAEGSHYNQSNMYFYLTTNRLISDNTNVDDEQMIRVATICTSDTSNYNCNSYKSNTFKGQFVEGVFDFQESQGVTISEANIYEYQRNCCYWKLVDSGVTNDFSEARNFLDEYINGNVYNAYPGVTNINTIPIDGKTSAVLYSTICADGFTYDPPTNMCKKNIPSSCTYQPANNGMCTEPGYDSATLMPNAPVCRYCKNERNETESPNYNYQFYKSMCCIATNGGTDCATAEHEGEFQGAGAECISRTTVGCKAGYELSDDGFCYKKDTEELRKKLVELLDLIDELKACKKSLKSFDYYLETDMELDYNETSDSPKDYGTKETNPLSQTYSKTGASDIINGEKSNISEGIWLNGKHYTISANGVPYTTCTWIGIKKYCTTNMITGLNDYWYDYYAKVYVAEYDYSMNKNFYRWIRLPESVSTSQEPTGDYKKYNRFIDIGHANYPVHFSTPKGNYEGLNIKINNIGYKNYLYNTYGNQIINYNKILTDEDLKSSYSEEKNVLLHDCYYEVKEGEPFCPTGGCDNGGGSGDGSDDGLGGIRIIYRPISLENPFPSIDADGRVTGNNWCHLNNSDEALNCSNLNENVDRYILNNRNISGSSVYNKEPMYEINLTPALIKQIREYNKTINYDDFNLSCSGEEGKTGRECRSNFVVNVSDIDLPSLRDYITGCGVGEWDDCDKLDGYDREHERFYSLTGYTVSNE